MDERDVRRVAERLGTVVDVRPEGRGGDHVAWRVTTTDGTWVVRAPADDRAPDGAAANGSAADDVVTDVRAEAAVMDLVRHAVGAWVADVVVLDDAHGWIAHRRIDGEPLQDALAAGRVPAGRIAAIARELGRFVAAVAAIDVGGVDVALDDTPLEEWRDGVAELLADVRDVLGPSRAAAVERFVAADPPEDAHPSELALAHNDLGAEHVVVDPANWAINGVIDWSDAAVADPAAELGRVLRDLGDDALDAALGELDQPADERARLRARATFYARCLVVEDVAHAAAHRPDLLALALANTDRLHPTT